MEKKELISIVVPVYNAQASIVAVLDAVKNQTFQNFEIITVNDGSTDASENEIKQFAALNPALAITYIFQRNKGVSAARNAGMAAAKGEYIALLDSDDLWEREKLEMQMKLLRKHPEIDFLGTNRDGTVYTQLFGKEFKELNHISARLLLLKNFFMTSSVVFKRQIPETVGYFNEKMSHCEDYEYFLRIAAKHQCYLYNRSMVTSFSGKHQFGESGLSSNLWKMEKGELQTMKKAHELKLVKTPKYLLVSGFSILKFFRRLILTQWRR